MTLSTALELVWRINPVFTYVQTCFPKTCVLNAKTDLHERSGSSFAEMLKLLSTSTVMCVLAG